MIEVSPYGVVEEVHPKTGSRRHLTNSADIPYTKYSLAFDEIEGIMSRCKCRSKYVFDFLARVAEDRGAQGINIDLAWCSGWGTWTDLMLSTAEDGIAFILRKRATLPT